MQETARLATQFPELPAVTRVVWMQALQDGQSGYVVCFERNVTDDEVSKLGRYLKTHPRFAEVMSGLKLSDVFVTFDGLDPDYRALIWLQHQLMPRQALSGILTIVKPHERSRDDTPIVTRLKLIGRIGPHDHGAILTDLRARANVVKVVALPDSMEIEVTFAAFDWSRPFDFVDALQQQLYCALAIDYR